jgi:hypothetical protein
MFSILFLLCDFFLVGGSTKLTKHLENGVEFILRKTYLDIFHPISIKNSHLLDISKTQSLTDFRYALPPISAEHCIPASSVHFCL